MPQNNVYRKPIIFFKLNHCIRCHRDAIEIYSHYGKPMNYAQMIMNRNNKNWRFNPNIPIGACKCRACGQNYVLRYDTDGFPIPISIPEFYQNVFIDTYIKLGKEREEKLKSR